MQSKSKPCWISHLSCCAALSLAFAGCGGGTGGSGPVLLSIPPQTVQNGVVAIDLVGFVVNPAAASFEYSVVSGGGFFTGSTYENTFDTIGTYSVTFQVGTGTAKSQASFDVVVQSANLAVVQVDGKYNRLLDTDTERFVEVSASSFPETFRKSLAKGQLVYERTIGSNIDLFVFEVIERRNVTLGDDATKVERYVAKTSDDLVVFSVGTGTDTDLRIWNPANGAVRDVSAVAGEVEGNAMVTDEDIVFHERALNGNGDVYFYDPTADTSTPVSTDSADETLLGTVAGGAVVFGRPGTVAETDLFYFSRTAGVLQVGQDVASLDTQDKTLHGGTSDGRVVFSATDGAATNIYVWNPADSTTALASSTTATEVNTFQAITPGDFVVFTATDSVNPGTDDVFGYSVTDDAVEMANAGNAAHTFEAVGRIASDDFVVYTIPGGSTALHVYNFATDVRGDATVASYRFDDVLSDGRVVFTQTTVGGALFLYDANAVTFETVVTGLGVPTYRHPGAVVGDVVFELDIGAQSDLFHWDDSADQVVTVSDDAVADTFQAVNPGGKIVFSRVLGGNTTADLFVFDPSDSSTTRLTDVDGIGQAHDHAVVGTYAASQ